MEVSKESSSEIYREYRRRMRRQTLEDVFMWSCKEGHLDISKKIYSENKIDIVFMDDYSFKCACMNGHFETAKWIQSLKEIKNISVETSYDTTFAFVCSGGYLDMAKWLYSLDLQINIHNQDDLAFTRSFRYGYLDVAKWLYSLDDKINIETLGKELMKYSMKMDRYDNAGWLSDKGIDTSVCEKNKLNKYYEWLYNPDNTFVEGLIKNFEDNM